jgi:hypothetical protein
MKRMSVHQRVLDAEFLWNSNHREGAWILAMIATAATARKRYPRPTPDNQAFKQYVQDISYTIVSGKPKPPNLQKGQLLVKFGERPFEDVLYKDYRCSWVHEAGLDNAGLSESKIEGDNIIIETLVVGEHPQIPENWLLNLLNAIRWSPENAGEFDGR